MKALNAFKFILYLILVMMTQWVPKKWLDVYQNWKLRRVIRHASLHVPFYRNLFTRLKISPADIKTKKRPCEVASDYEERYFKGS